MAEHPGANTHLLGHFAHGRLPRTDQHGQQGQLVKRGLIFEPRGEVDQVVVFDHGIFKHRRAAAGGALTEAIPVVALTHTRLLHADRRDHVGTGVVPLGIQVDPVGEQAAGAVELGAIGDPLLALAADAGDHLADLHVADFGPGVADQFPGHKPLEPGVLWAECLGVEAVFDKRKMPAQGLGHVGVGGRQFNQQLEQLRQRGAGAAEFDRDTHGAEPGFFQPLDRFERQRARAFALDRPLGDTGEDRPKTLGERFVIGTDRQCVQRGKTGHGRASSSARISVKSGQKIWTVWCDRWRWPRF